jgi:hypothetical protein
MPTGCEKPARMRREAGNAVLAAGFVQHMQQHVVMQAHGGIRVLVRGPAVAHLARSLPEEELVGPLDGRDHVPRAHHARRQAQHHFGIGAKAVQRATSTVRSSTASGACTRYRQSRRAVKL